MKDNKLNKKEIRDYLIGQIAPIVTRYDPRFGTYVVADKNQIYSMPKSKIDQMIKQKARDLGIQFDSFM